MNLKKDHKEIILIVTSVLFVGMIGLLLQHVAIDNGSSNVAGAAISLDSNTPTYSGMLYLLREHCSSVEADGISSCDKICESSGTVCVPLEETCSEVNDEQCFCCDDASE